MTKNIFLHNITNATTNALFKNTSTDKLHKNEQVIFQNSYNRINIQRNKVTTIEQKLILQIIIAEGKYIPTGSTQICGPVKDKTKYSKYQSFLLRYSQ